MRKKYLNTTELCVLFPITKQTAFNWRKEGMPFYGREGPGNLKFYIESEVLAWLAKKGKDPNAKKVERADRIKAKKAAKKKKETDVMELIKEVYPKTKN